MKINRRDFIKTGGMVMLGSLAAPSFLGSCTGNGADQATVWVAIKGYTPYYISERGVISVDSEGNNTWRATRTGKHIRLIESLPAKEMEDLLEQYMMHCPKH